MPNFEAFPAPAVPERASRPEDFLEKEGARESLLGSLSQVFAYIDRLLPAQRQAQSSALEEEIAAAGGHGAVSPDAMRVLMFNERFGPNVLENAMRGGDADREMTTEERGLLDDYQKFLELFDDPDLRPGLLSKLVCMRPEEKNEEMADSWSTRRAFSRFLVEFYGHEKKDAGVKEHFLSLDAYPDLVEAWSIKGDWGFTKEQFDEMRGQLPEIRERMKKYAGEPLVAPVLTPFLPDKRDASGEIVQGGMIRTFAELSGLMAAAQKWNVQNSAYDDLSEENIRLVEGIEHSPGLRFEILDLGSGTDQAPASVRGPQSPHAQVLAMAASNPEWIRATGDESVPYPWIPGYRVSSSADEPWESAPMLSFEQRIQKIHLHATRSDEADENWVVPSLRD